MKIIEFWLKFPKGLIDNSLHCLGDGLAPNTWKAITEANLNALWCHMVSPGHNELNVSIQKLSHHDAWPGHNELMTKLQAMLRYSRWRL